MTRQDIIRLILTIVVSIATSIGSFFGISTLTSCETVDSISLGASIKFPLKETTEFEESITNPPLDTDIEWSPDIM